MERATLPPSKVCWELPHTVLHGYLFPAAAALRLVDGNNPAAGRLEMAVNGVWGRVSWPAGAACKERNLTTLSVGSRERAGMAKARCVATRLQSRYGLPSQHSCADIYASPLRVCQVFYWSLFTDSVASVACRQLGLPTPGRVLPAASFGTGSGPIWVCEYRGVCAFDSVRLTAL